MKTRTSWLSFFLRLFGSLAIGISILAAGSGDLVRVLAFGGVGSVFIIAAKLLQHVQNIESYLQHIAQNSSPVISDYPTKRYEEKPIEALKAAVKPPAKNDDDVKKYGPK
jgi:hypothetical protein